MKNSIVNVLSNLSLLYIVEESHTALFVVEKLKLTFEKILIAHNAKEAQAIYSEERTDFILVDINFPKMDVVKFIKELRCSDKSTQIALSFSYEDIYKVLKIVEQDISKLLLNPITNSDLEKLFEVFSKRYNLNITYEISNFCVFEPNDFKIRCQNNSYSLTKKECIFLEIMFKNQKTISYQDMKEYLWKDSSMNDNVIHTFIKNIRKKLPPKTILTIKGVGYKMN